MALAVVRTDADDTDVTAIAPGNLKSAITDEVFAHATPEQAQSFFAAVGRRIAAGHELPLDGALADLETGQVRLEVVANKEVEEHPVVAGAFQVNGERRLGHLQLDLVAAGALAFLIPVAQVAQVQQVDKACGAR